MGELDYAAENREPESVGERKEAARTLQRRLKAKDRYRRRRDHKIAVDYIGKEFEQLVRDDLHGMECLRLVLVSYNPDNHTIKLRPMWDPESNPLILWDTDSFWFMLKSGRLLPC